MSAIAPEHGQRLSTSQLPIEEILPIEIIAHIFILCLPQDPLRHNQPALSKAPLLLCHVCSVWRSISLNTPQLWNNFHHKLRISRSSLSDPFWGILPSSLDFMEWWSKNVRGQSLSLRLALKWTQNSSGWPKNDPDRSVAFLFSMFNSVQILEIEQSYALIVEQQFQPSPSQYPNLEFISILEDADDPIGTYSPQGISPSDVSACDFSFFRAPSLKKLVIRKNYFHPDSAPKAQVLFSPGGLTHLFVNLTLSLSTWSDFISGCANLEYARIHLKVLREDSAATTPTTRFILPKLRQLIIDCSSRQLNVLDHLLFPSLHYLHFLIEAPSSYPLSFDTLTRLLNATPSLRVLHISVPFPCRWTSHNTAYVTFPPSIPNHQRLRNCAPSLELLVLEVFKSTRAIRGMPPLEYMSEMKNSGWLENVPNHQTSGKLRVVLVGDFPRNIIDGLNQGEWAIGGVHMSAALGGGKFCILGNSQNKYPRDRWFKEARCERLI